MAADSPPPEMTGAYVPQDDETLNAETLTGRSDVDPAEQVGSKIGPYTLVELLGQGGMGAVYRAEQVMPVRRQVALKVIKPGMDSAVIVARFKAELDALAMMEHVNIAKVLDAGATETGRPYFVMELVLGVPITDYCDQNRLDTRQRLELFIAVCQALQHAHQKGIIHRDIKPSNVLVSNIDGKPVPKVIDFGLARATAQASSDEGFTQYGTVVGTLEYMSPEQAEFSPQGIDTRTDIYSLGVLLYELLTGTTPLEWDSLRNSGFANILRSIKEVEPPKPSTRIAQSDSLVHVATARKIEPGQLPKLVRGELDWIVMKSLEKDRNRRYETANSFAQDVQRYLNDETVEACPPSFSYRLKKFARRHRTLLGTATLLLLMLIAGLVFSARQAIIATEARNRAQEAQAEAQVANFRRLTEERHQLIVDGTSRSMETLVAVAAAFETWPDLDRSQFHSFTTRCMERHPEISSMTWVPRVLGGERARVEAAVRAEGFDDFEFRELNADGTYTGEPAAEQPVYYPIIYVEPLEPNRVILGMDSSANPPRLATLEQARDTGEMVASSPLLLGEETEGEMGFLLFQPVYRGPASTVEQRRQSLTGFAVAAFRIQDMIDNILQDLAKQEVAIAIYDVESGDTLVYTNVPDQQVDWDQMSRQQSLTVAGRHWRVEFASLEKEP